ncbi:formylglycine-generating enzyme required for sulfatase activity [Tahibacter aquaticus]|uniref:Formylglycine-generating enzyme required for sulfatase activity n=1 Tax=Tahibacter aquaticus TaxID=520092 RepID=A0A4R6YUC2_9GAMM|nr:SUMF1/EgtB/PvdO family nonheme iron enzyme [Tahibacter aquaticus]TDR42031.1 formylglycine-generating enzyme required for sulfatase activity [Tahibacter aquaticus]
MSKSLRYVLLLSICWLAASCEAAERMALVIGNAAYDSGPLRNPRNDADDIAALLRGLPEPLRFQVVLGHDLKQAQMIGKVKEFRAGLQPGGIGLIFYAGHAVEYQARNYLLPVDNGSIHSVEDAQLQGIDVKALVEQMESAGPRLSLVILDACRDNPTLSRQRSASRGLARIDARQGTLIAYAASEGMTAAEGEGRNSPYTAALLKLLVEPGLELSQVFNRVGAEVARATAGGQIPWYSSSPLPVVLLGGEAKTRPTAGAASELGELWLRVEPQAGELYVDGGFVGTGAQTLADLPANVNSRIEARLAGYQPAEKIVFVKPGAPTAVLLRLQPLEQPVVREPAQPQRHFQDPLHSTGFGPVMQRIPAGSIELEQTVAVGAFSIAETEVSFADYQLCVDAGACADPPVARSQRQSDLPVTQVSWDDARRYSTWLGKETGRKYRLPTEIEWLYAAFPGRQTVYWWGNDVGQARANCKGCGSRFEGRLAPVKSFAPNDFGLYDTAGNVWEWTQDCFRVQLGLVSAVASGLDRCPSRARRGGAWNSGPASMSESARAQAAPDLRSGDLGFRVAADP